MSGWETVTWDRGDHVHVLPLADVVAHAETPDGECICCPQVEPVSRPDGSIGWMYVHHSLDGRELVETGGG